MRLIVLVLIVALSFADAYSLAFKIRNAYDKAVYNVKSLPTKYSRSQFLRSNEKLEYRYVDHAVAKAQREQLKNHLQGLYFSRPSFKRALLKLRYQGLKLGDWFHTKRFENAYQRAAKNHEIYTNNVIRQAGLDEKYPFHTNDEKWLYRNNKILNEFAKPTDAFVPNALRNGDLIKREEHAAISNEYYLRRQYLKDLKRRILRHDYDSFLWLNNIRPYKERRWATAVKEKEATRLADEIDFMF
jgi:hypothetical protein